MPDLSDESQATVDALIAQYLKSADRGTPQDPEQFIEAHREHESALRRYFENLALFEDLVQADADRNGETPTEMVSDTRVPSAPPEPEIPREFGHYVVDHVLGRGAMGTVYAAYDRRLDRHVALKVPHLHADVEVRRRFLREARSAARFHHPNFCPVYEVGEVDGRHYISMAWIRGFTLRDFARSEVAQPERQVALLIRKLALAISEAHRHGILHRDLKSANVMVDESGEPIVMDFGLATLIEDDADATQTGTIVGTPAYMAPEQVDGESQQIGPPTDVYGLGVVLYELLTGRLPFSGRLHSVLKQITCDTPTPLSRLRPDLDPRLESICLKMMAQRVEDRYQSMDEVAAALAEFLAAPAVEEASLGTTSSRTSDPGGSTAPPAGAGRRTKVWIAFVLPAGAALLYGIVTLFLRLGEVNLKIVIDDDTISAVRFDDETITFENSGETIRIRPGKRSFIVERAGLEAESLELVVRNAGSSVLHVTVIDGELVAIMGDANIRGQVSDSSLARDGNSPSAGSQTYPPGSSSEILTSVNWEWTEPENLGPSINTEHVEGGPCLSGDGLTLVFHSDRDGGFGAGDFWMSTRKTPTSPWSEPENLGPNINTSDSEDDPCLSNNGLTLVFGRHRARTGRDSDLWIATRADADQDWSLAVNLGTVVNSDANDSGPALSPDGLSLIFNSQRPGGVGVQDLWQSRRESVNDAWPPPQNLGPGTNSPAYQGWATIAGDGLSLIFNSNRSGGPVAGPLWVCTRDSSDADWSDPVRLLPAEERSVWSACLSADATTLLFDSKRSGGHGNFDIWMTRRVRRASDRDPSREVPPVQ